LLLCIFKGLSFSGLAWTFKLLQSHKTLVYPFDEVLTSEKNLKLLQLTQCANWKTMFHYEMPLPCMKHTALRKLQNQIKVAQMQWSLQQWASELRDNM
jgi:hypothetical protein